MPRQSQSDSGDECRVVIWRDGRCRCELWALSNGPHLRVYDGDRLLTQEPGPRGQLYQRAQELRSAYAGF